MLLLRWRLLRKPLIDSSPREFSIVFLNLFPGDWQNFSARAHVVVVVVLVVVVVVVVVVARVNPILRTKNPFLLSADAP